MNTGFKQVRCYHISSDLKALRNGYEVTQTRLACSISDFNQTLDI